MVKENNKHTQDNMFTVQACYWDNEPNENDYINYILATHLVLESV